MPSTKLAPAERQKQLRALYKESRDLIAKLKGYQGRELNDEEKAAYQALVDKVDELDERVAALEAEEPEETPTPPAGGQNAADLTQILKRIADHLDGQGGGQATPPSPGRRSKPEAPGHTRDLDDKRAINDPKMALRGWALVNTGMATRDHFEASERVGFDMRSQTLHFRLAEKAPKNQKEIDQRYADAIKEHRAQSTLTGAAGAFLIQTDLQKEVEEALLYYADLRQICQVIRTDQGNPLDIPFMDDTANKGEIVTENTAFNSQDLTLAKRTLNAWLYNSKMINCSLQFLQDVAVNPTQMIGKAAGERLGRIQADHHSTGSGTGQPAGLLTATIGSALGRTATSATAISNADLLNLIHSVDRAYRPGAYWMGHDNILMQLRLITDAQGRPIFTESYRDGEPAKIHGYPFLINNGMASTMASGNKTLAFGAIPDQYRLRDAMDITFRRLDERFAELGQVGFIALMRHDARLLNVNAVKHLIHP